MSCSVNKSLLELPELVIDPIANHLDNEDRCKLMATSRKYAQLVMGRGSLRLRVDDRVEWMRLKQVLLWAKGLRHLVIQTTNAYKPLAEQADQQDLAACSVLLGPAYSSYVDGLSLPGVQTVTIMATGLPCLVPHFIAAVCPNLTNLVYQPGADTTAATFVETTPESLPIPLCVNQRHIECHKVCLPRGYHFPQDLRRQLPNITSLKLKELSLKWLNSWSHQLTRLQLDQYCKDDCWYTARVNSAQPAQQLQHLTIAKWDGKLPIHIIAPAVTALELPGHQISQDSMQHILQLTSLQHLTASILDTRSLSPSFKVEATAPILETLVLSQHFLSERDLYLIAKLTGSRSLTVADFEEHLPDLCAAIHQL